MVDEASRASLARGIHHPPVYKHVYICACLSVHVCACMCVFIFVFVFDSLRSADVCTIKYLTGWVREQHNTEKRMQKKR